MSGAATVAQPQTAATLSSKKELKRVLFLGDELFITAAVEIVCAMPSPDLDLVCFSASERMTRELVAKQAVNVIAVDYLTHWIDVDEFKATIQRMDPNILVVPLSAVDTTQIQTLLAKLKGES